MAVADYSDQVLEETPPRVAQFLAGIGAIPTIRTLLAQAGMSDDDLKEGRTLLLACLAAPENPEFQLDTDDARAQREAVAELDQWDEPNFARYKAALNRRFPSAGAYVFRNLAASTGINAVTGVAMFLLRIEALESGSDPEREGHKQEDKKAVKLLETRGLDKAERARLKKLVDRALGPTSALPKEALTPPKDARRAALVELKEWFEEWSTTARAVVKKRGFQIRMGLATRKMGKKGKVEGKGGAAPEEEEDTSDDT